MNLPAETARYVQVGDLLEQAAEFHGRMSDFYHRLSDKVERGRVRLLLDYMSTHEKNLRDSLEDYDDEASAGILNTWVDRDYCDRIVHACEQLPGEPELDVDKLRQWKDGIVDRLTSGVEFLCSKNGVEVVHGAARFQSDRSLRVETDDGSVEIEFSAAVIATGIAAFTALNSAFRDGIVRQVMAFVAPKLLGGRAAPTPLDGEGVRLIADPLRVTEPRTTRLGDDFSHNPCGTGPFRFVEYLPQTRMVLERNPDFWGSDANGTQLPYLDGITFVFFPDPTARTTAIQTGNVDWIEYVPAADVEILRIGTKVPAVLPQRITPALVRSLRRHHPLWMSLHFTHPDECTPEALRACTMLADAGIEVWIGAEPTFTLRSSESPEWLSESLGGTKQAYAERILQHLQQHYPGSLVLRTIGRQYPGEERARWSLGLYRRRDGAPLANVLPADPLDAGASCEPQLVEDFWRSLVTALDRHGWQAAAFRATDRMPLRVLFRLDGEPVETDPQQDPRLARPSLHANVIPLDGAVDELASEGRYLLSVGCLTGSAENASVPCLELPAMPDVPAFLVLIRLVSEAAAMAGLSQLVWQGHPPPVDHTVAWATLTPDPAVVEINTGQAVHPSIHSS